MEQRHAKEQDGWKTKMVQRSLEQYIQLAALGSVALEMNCPIKKEPYHKRTGANKYICICEQDGVGWQDVPVAVCFHSCSQKA